MLNTRFRLMFGALPVVIAGNRKDLTRILGVLRVELGVIDQRLVFGLNIRRILIFVSKIAEMKQEGGRRCVASSTICLGFGNLVRHRSGHAFTGLLILVKS